MVITPLQFENRKKDFSVKFTFSHYENYLGFLQEQADLEAEKARLEMLQRLKEECEDLNEEEEDTNSTSNSSINIKYIWDDEAESCIEKQIGGEPTGNPDNETENPVEPPVILTEEEIKAQRIENFKEAVSNHNTNVSGGRKGQTFHYLIMVMVIIFALALCYLYSREERKRVYFAKNKIKKIEIRYLHRQLL